jgi:signal transduction histidine kinase
MVIYILFIIMFANSLHANNYIDSLNNELQKKMNSDTLELEIRRKIANYYVINSPDSADKYIADFNLRAEMLENKKYMAETFLLYSLKYAYSGDLKKSNEELYKAENFTVKYQLQEQLNTVYLTLGINNIRLGVYDEAIKYLNKSLELAESRNDAEMIGRTYVSLGIFFNKNDNLEKERFYLKKALDISKKYNLRENMATANSNLATNYSKAGKLDSALFYIKESIKHYDAKNSKNSLSIAYHNLAAIYYDLDSTALAIGFLKKSIELKKEVNNKVGVANSEYGLGEIYFQNSQFDSAKVMFEKSLDIYKETGMLRKQQISYNMLDSIARRKNNYKEAYYYSNLAHKIQDSIFNERNSEIIAEYETKYEVAEKERDNHLLRMQSQKQKFIIVIVLLVIMLIFVVTVIMFLRHRSAVKTNDLLNEKNSKIAEKNTKLKVLNKQLKQYNRELKGLNATKDKFFAIISHDLKGPVSSSYMLIDTVRKHYEVFSEEEKKDNLDLLYDATYNTYLLLENLLTWSRTQRNKIEFNPEETFIKNAVDITISHLLVFSEQKNIKVNNKISNDIKLKFDVNMISTVFRNLINNSIKFTNENGEINVSATEKEDSYIFSIADNGIGMTAEIRDNLFKIDKTKSRRGTNDEKGTGLGLIIALEFIQIHKGKITVESEPEKGSIFNIELPKK